MIVERIKMLKEMNDESRDYLAEDKEEFLNCLYENGINSFMLGFLSKLFAMVLLMKILFCLKMRL